MYKILRSDGAVLYDINDPNTMPVTEPKGTFEIGQAGSVQFALVPAHPLYDEVGIMKTYVSVLRENAEIFYGRIIDVNVDKITGIKRIECAGALQFLDDGELPPVTNPADSSKGVDLTASAFFTRCIEAYNAEIGNDPKRVLSVGTVSHAKAQMTKTYHLTGYTKVKNALDSNLISEYGGYFRVRKENGGHVIDWLDTYSEPNTSPIELRKNIQNQENAISAGDFFTMIRPSGKNNMVLSPVALSSELVNEYGRIIKSVNFKDEETEAGLNEAVTEYIAETAKGAGKTATIKLVDMHFLDGSIPVIRMGSTYTNIAGFEGEPMVVSGMELNFANSADDSITLKNAKDLESGSKGSVTSKGSIAKETSGSKGFQNIWQHITEGEDWLRLFAERIEINAQNLVEVVGTFERYAQETTETIQIQGQEITAIHGTGVLQNSDQITQVAGMFSSKYYLVPVASRTGRNPSTAGWYEATQYQVSENDINSGIELFPSVSAALSGRAINTASGLTPYIGQWVTRMVHTSDTTPTAGKNYYTKSLGLLDGASFMITEEGVETNVGVLLKETSEGVGENERQIALIQGSALWVYRDQITGVTGEYEVITNQDGTKTLVIKSGGGLKIRRNDVEYGIYDEDSLTGGIIVSKLNDNSVMTSIRGDHVDLSTNTAFGTISSTVGAHTTSINSLGQRVSTVEGSALWQSRNDITDVVGAFEYVTVPGTGQRYLVVKDGGAFKLRRNSVEFGVYDEYSLTAGVIVDKVNGGSVYLKGSKVWVGDASTDQTLKKWATESDGLFAQNIGALSARIGTIEADYIDTDHLSADISALSAVYVTSLYVGGISYAPNAVCKSVTATNDNGQITFTQHWMGGGSTPIITFSPAATLVTGWSGSTTTGQTYTATAGNQSDTFTLSGQWTMGSPSYPNTLYHTTFADGAGRLQEGYDLTAYKAAAVAEGEGHFSKAALTLQGSSVSVTPIGTERRYTIVSRYKGDGGTYIARGNTQAAYVADAGGSYHLRGTSVSRRYSGTLYYFSSTGQAISAGNGSWFLSGQNTLYQGDGAVLGSTTLYKGDGGSIVARGTSEDVYILDNSGAVRNYLAGSPTTYYNAGTSYTAENSPYYTKNS